MGVEAPLFSWIAIVFSEKAATFKAVTVRLLRIDVGYQVSQLAFGGRFASLNVHESARVCVPVV